MRVFLLIIYLNKLENIRFDIIDGQYDNIGTATIIPTIAIANTISISVNPFFLILLIILAPLKETLNPLD